MLNRLSSKGEDERSSSRLFLVLLLLFLKNSFLGRFNSLPKLFTANTSAGTHKLAQGLASAPESQAKKLAAPVRQSEEKAGVFLATRKDIVAWVQSKAPSLAITSEMFIFLAIIIWAALYTCNNVLFNFHVRCTLLDHEQGWSALELPHYWQKKTLDGTGKEAVSHDGLNGTGKEAVSHDGLNGKRLRRAYCR
ncbi:hypothetical protein RHSIM_Rhsim07G0124600 [Rhododendron simsii]|uniref:Uncharacterized protein n=1 Tax=Rhododendron simsii TaxID=118357 RepID=A0A834GPA7_RHOSS|nr:hypothetical protein RHSIM_Rhsim07G0124600 [Rhododendron simsii]